MRLAPLVVIVVLLGSACTRVLDISGADWRRQGTSIQQVTLDEMECARSSEKDGDLPDTVIGGFADLVVVSLEDKLRGASYDRCMQKKGYASAVTESH